MAALAQRHPSDSGFVGQLLVRKSPILTWRPALAVKLAEEAETRLVPPAFSYDTDVGRPSRLSTRRVIAWPVAARVVRRSPVERAWRAAVRAVAAVAVLAVVALVASSAPWPRAPHTLMVAERASAARSLAEGCDVLGAATAASVVATRPPSKVDHARPVPRHGRRAHR